MVVVAALGGVAGTVCALKEDGSERYLGLLQRADQLWQDYKAADREFFEHDRPDAVAHVTELARVQDRLAALHEEWMAIEVPDELAVTDLKVGLALELQMAAIGAEIVGVLDDDQDYLDLSASLDEGYAGVVDDL
jgi:hypothetical protein